MIYEDDEYDGTNAYFYWVLMSIKHSMSTFCELIYLILIIALRTGWCYYPHISCEEIKGGKKVINFP